MTWACIKGRWKLFRDAGKRAQLANRVRQASEKQLADWIAREHKANPIHK